MSNPLRRAYRDAWRVRQQTGDESPDLLMDRLRAESADPVWLEPDGELHQWLMGVWGRGVSPRGMSVEAAKQMGRLIPVIVKPYREILRHLR